jgi:hypothetical protein
MSFFERCLCLAPAPSQDEIAAILAISSLLEVKCFEEKKRDTTLFFSSEHLLCLRPAGCRLDRRWSTNYRHVLCRTSTLGHSFRRLGRCGFSLSSLLALKALFLNFVAIDSKKGSHIQFIHIKYKSVSKKRDPKP